MKVSFSKITLWFTVLGFCFALMDVILSLIYGASRSPAVQQALSEIAYASLLVCPFAWIEHGLEHLQNWSDIAWVYFEIVALNTLLYFVLGLACSFVVHTVRQVIAARPR